MLNSYLNFASDYFDQLNIQTTVFLLNEDPDPSVDFGLRKTIIKGDKLRFMDLGWLRTNHDKPVFYFVTDRYLCQYIMIPIPNQEISSVFMIGPYITFNFSIKKIQTICDTMMIPHELSNYLHQYYSGLPFIKDQKNLEVYINTLGKALYGISAFSISYFNEKPDVNTVFSNVTPKEYDDITRIQTEKRYEQEKLLMDSIASGNFKAAEKASFSDVFENLDERSTSSIQSKRTYLIVFNTLCRKAAERSGLHPVFIDAVSRKNGIRIDALTTFAEADQLRREIIQNYCSAVNSNQTRNYSERIQNIVNYISFNLSSEQLTLQDIARQFDINKSYLSTLFKHETGFSLTEYVTKKRIDYAAYLLSTQKSSIQSIAFASGIPDVTYFTRLFKRQKGITPTQYRKNILHTTQKTKSSGKK